MRKYRIRVFLGFLSFTCAEILAGSSPNWIIDPWAYLVTIPLYISHFLFFMALAIKTSRTRLRDLYFWGILFGLYETWITKVIWSGYSHDGSFALGSVGGFGIHETLVLVLFWHPILAFILPLVLSVKFLGVTKAAEDLFPGLTWFLSLKPSAQYIRFAIVLIAGVTLGFNAQSPIIVVITATPILLVLYLGYRFLILEPEATTSPTSAQDELDMLVELFDLERPTMAAVGGYLVLLYSIGFVAIVPSQFPNMIQIVGTLVIYLVVIVLLMIVVKPVDTTTTQLETNTIRLKIVVQYYLIIIGIATVLSLILSVTSVIFVIIAIAEVPLSIFTANFFIRKKYLL